MSLLIEMSFPAVVLSVLAGCSLLLAAKAPPRVRFWIAVTGLIPWAVPWPLMSGLMSRGIMPVEPSVAMSFIRIPATEIAGMTTRLTERLIAQDTAMNGILERM